MADLREEFVWFEVEMDLAFDLENVDEEVLQAFVDDGGEPWDIYRTESAFLGAPLS